MSSIYRDFFCLEICAGRLFISVTVWERLSRLLIDFDSGVGNP